MRALSLLVLVFPIASVACSANVAGSPEAADAEASSSSAIVVVERTTSSADARASAVARFVRMRAGAVDDDALRMVGATVEFPAMGSCASLAVKSSANPRAAELVDVGLISLEASGIRTSLQPRRLPDVVDLISGVVYATQASDADALPAESSYVLRVAGGSGAGEQAVAPFMVTAVAPPEPLDVRVLGQDARNAVTVPGGVAVDLSWDVRDPSVATDDIVYVDVAGSAPSALAARCLFPDTGAATLPAALFEPEGTLTLHRLHHEPFHVKGVAAGDIRFDFARTVSFTRR